MRRNMLALAMAGLLALLPRPGEAGRCSVAAFLETARSADAVVRARLVGRGDDGRYWASPLELEIVEVWHGAVAQRRIVIPAVHGALLPPGMPEFNRGTELVLALSERGEGDRPRLHIVPREPFGLRPCSVAWLEIKEGAAVGDINAFGRSESLTLSRLKEKLRSQIRP